MSSSFHGVCLFQFKFLLILYPTPAIVAMDGLGDVVEELDGLGDVVEEGAAVPAAAPVAVPAAATATTRKRKRRGGKATATYTAILIAGKSARGIVHAKSYVGTEDGESYSVEWRAVQSWSFRQEMPLRPDSTPLDFHRAAILRPEGLGAARQIVRHMNAAEAYMLPLPLQRVNEILSEDTAVLYSRKAARDPVSRWRVVGRSVFPCPSHHRFHKASINMITIEAGHPSLS